MRRAHDHRARQRRSTRRSRPVMLASTIGQPAGLPTPHATTGRRDRRRPTRRARDRGDRKAHAMNGRVAKHAFATRPGDADTWVRMREAPISRESKAGLFTARLTIDDTPGQCGRIKVTTLQRGQIVADMLRELRARGFSYKRRLAMNAIAAAGRRSMMQQPHRHVSNWTGSGSASALDSLRTDRQKEGPQSPVADLQLPAARRLHFRALGAERPPHDHLSHRHRTRSCAG